MITCDAERSLINVPHKLFGLGRLPVVDGVVKYGLYPKVVLPDNTTSYLDHTWQVVNSTTDAPVPMNVFFGEKVVDFGIRVTDEKCYKRIVSFLDSIVDERKVTLNTVAEIDPVVSLIGEVFIVEPTQDRRAFAIEWLGGLTSGFFPGKFGGLSLGGLGL